MAGNRRPGRPRGAARRACPACPEPRRFGVEGSAAERAGVTTQPANKKALRTAGRTGPTSGDHGRGVRHGRCPYSAKSVQKQKRSSNIEIAGALTTIFHLQAYSFSPRCQDKNCVIAGAYHKFSEKHLDAYLDEFEWRFNNRKNPFLFRDTMLKLINSPNLEYRELTAKQGEPA